MPSHRSHPKLEYSNQIIRTMANRSTHRTWHPTRNSWQIMNLANRSQENTQKTSEAANKQSKLGRDLVMEGCLSKKWRGQQEAFWKAFCMRRLSKRWTSELIKKLLGVAWDMWQHQNKALHENQENRPHILETETNSWVTELYNLGPSAFTNSISLFKHSLSELLLLPHAYKKHWVETAAIAKAHQDQRKAGPYQSERRAIQIWLTTINRTAI